MKNKIILRIIDVILTVIIWLFFLAVILIGIRVFVFDTFRIPSNSMNPTIINGDKVLVNKLIFGARIYKNLDFMEGDSLEIWRVKGFRAIRHNDLLVFNYPYEKNRSISFDISIVHLKRCVGIPGDTISIRNGFLQASSYLDTLGHYAGQLELSLADSIRYEPGIFRALPRGRSGNNWTIRNLGPLYVPEQGGKINIDSTNYRLYGSIIEYETGKKLHFTDSIIMLGKVEIKQYIFLNNYYFAVGDNAINSRDSRYWGFVPEEYIVGIASRILYSKDPYTGKYRRDRWLKSLI